MKMIHSCRRLSLILFFYLFSTYIGATHIHHDPLMEPSDCKVCVVAKNLHGNDILPATPLLTDIVVAYAVTTRHEIRVSTPLYKGFDAHAPPA